MEVSKWGKASALAAALATAAVPAGVAKAQEVRAERLPNGVVNLTNTPAPQPADMFTPTKQYYRPSPNPPAKSEAPAPSPGEKVCYVGKLDIDVEGDLGTSKAGSGKFTEPDTGYTIGGLQARSNPYKRTGWVGNFFGDAYGAMAVPSTPDMRNSGNALFTLRTTDPGNPRVTFKVTSSDNARPTPAWEGPVPLTRRDIMGAVVSSTAQKYQKGVGLNDSADFLFDVLMNKVPNTPDTSLETDNEKQRGAITTVVCREF